MPALKASELRKKSTEELMKQLAELRRELFRLNTLSAKGIIGKESGKVKVVRRNIARILTVLRERGVKL